MKHLIGLLLFVGWASVANAGPTYRILCRAEISDLNSALKGVQGIHIGKNDFRRYIKVDGNEELLLPSVKSVSAPQPFKAENGKEKACVTVYFGN